MKIETENLILQTPESEAIEWQNRLQLLTSMGLDHSSLNYEQLLTDAAFKDENHQHFEKQIRKLIDLLNSDILVQIIEKKDLQEIGLIILSSHSAAEIDAGYYFYRSEDQKKYAHESFEKLIPYVETEVRKLSAQFSDLFHTDSKLRNLMQKYA